MRLQHRLVDCHVGCGIATREADQTPLSIVRHLRASPSVGMSFDHGRSGHRRITVSKRFIKLSKSDLVMLFGVGMDDGNRLAALDFTADLAFKNHSDRQVYRVSLFCSARTHQLAGFGDRPAVNVLDPLLAASRY